MVGVGTQIGRYKVLKLLGAGGMGSVYLAEHEDLRRRVALKVLHASIAAQPALVARFLNEARAATAIQSPAFVSVFDWDRTPEGEPYFVMEMLDGQSLDQRMDAGALPLQEALGIGMEAAAALEIAHARGIVHRDIKPANLFLALDPSAPDGVRLKVLDFGVAKISADLAVDGSNTRTGQMLGTPTYMAPEQCLGRKEIDHRADIYAMGCVLFEMVCGRAPFVSEGFGELINMHVNEPPPPASSVRPDVPRELDQVIARALAKNPDDRQQTMKQLGSELGEIHRRLGKRAAPTMAGDSAFTDEATKRTEPSPASDRERSARVIHATPASVATVPPVAVPTRPRGETTVSVRGGGRGWIAGLVGLALVIGGAVFMRTQRAAPAPAPIASAPPAPAPAPVALPPPVAAAPPPAPAAPPPQADVRLHLESTPGGASVRTVPGDEDLGTTPLDLERAPDTELAVRIVLPGHRPALRTLRFDTARTEEVRLEKTHRDRGESYAEPSRL